MKSNVSICKGFILLAVVLSGVISGCSAEVSDEKAKELFDFAIKYQPCPDFMNFVVDEMGNKWTSDEERSESAQFMLESFNLSYESDPTLSLPRALTTIIVGTVLSKSDSPLDQEEVFEAFSIAESNGVDISDAKVVWSTWITEVETWCKPYLDRTE